MNLRYIIKKRNDRLLIDGKVSYTNPHRIERQSILSSLITARKYAHGKMLDAGCGVKPYEEIFRNFVDVYIGIDVPNSLSTNKSMKNVDVYGSVLYMPFKSDSFDTILSTQVLEHVTDPSIALKEFYRILNHNGYLILTAPLTWGLHEIPIDYYRYTEYGLRYLAEMNKFEIVYIEPRGGFWGMIGQKLSGYVYYWYGVPKTLIGEAAKRAVCATIQILFSTLDKLDLHERDTLGYVMIAKKVVK